MGNIQETKFYKMWETNKEFYHFVMGVGVVILLVALITIGVQDHNLKEEISENCGWGEEDYECYCQKSEAIALKNELDFDMEDINVSVDR